MRGRGVATTPDWQITSSSMRGGGGEWVEGKGWGGLAARFGPLPRIVVVQRE